MKNENREITPAFRQAFETVGRMGGLTTKKRHGRKHFVAISKKAHAARRANGTSARRPDPKT